MRNYFGQSVSNSVFNFAPLRLCVFALIFFLSSQAQTLAPNAPGKDAQWSSAGKQAVGTSNTLESKIWFTLQGGMLTEVFYPQVDTANVNVLQFLAVDGGGNTETERDDAIHEIKVLRTDSLSFQQINTAKSDKWKITKTYTTDVERNTVLIDVKIERNLAYLMRFYVYYDPSLNNSGMHDTAWTQDGVLLSQEGQISSALVFQNSDKDGTTGFGYTNNGFLGTSGGTDYLARQAQDFFRHPNYGSVFKGYPRAENGNVTQTATIEYLRRNLLSR